MSLVIDLPQSVEARLEEEAQKAGVSVHELVQRTIAEKFPVELDENAQALRLIEQWIAEAPTDPEQIKEAEEDLREFQRSINQTRKEAGARLVYPEVQ
jgi:dimeric dUTPase (all-alpha-NTP-PPase superfamily)